MIHGDAWTPRLRSPSLIMILVVWQYFKGSYDFIAVTIAIGQLYEKDL